MEEKPNYYAIIPAEVRYNPNINANVKLLYGEIGSLSNKYGYCIATNEYFANLYNVSTRTITDWIKALEDMTYITKTIETKRYEDGTIKKIRKLYLNHIEISQQDHIEDSPQNHIEKNCSYNNTSNINNTSIKEIYKEKFKKPTLEEVEEYCKQRNSNVDAKTFYEYFETGGWVDSKGNKVKNWKQKVITWESSRKNNNVKEEPKWFNEEQNIEEVSEQEQNEIEGILNELRNNT